MESASFPYSQFVAGYDDKGTLTDGDDLCLIYDPWPEYNDKGSLASIPNATQGPGGTYDPYWLPAADVLLEAVTNDIYLAPDESVE